MLPASLNKMIRSVMLRPVRRKIKGERNLGLLDRFIRIGTGLFLFGFGVSRRNGLFGKALSILGGTLLLEGIASYSPFYDWMDFSSRGNGKF